MSPTSIRPTELKRKLAAGEALELIDVRTPVEFREIHVTCARNVPLDRLDPRAVLQDRSNSEEQPLYVICKGGSRGQQACQKFAAAGFTNVVNVEGGTEACVAEGLAVIRGKKTMSLERQVRIATGALVLTGAVLAATVHPYWIGLSGFVGAGLMFAGITDSCAMGMLIAKMPWNQCEDRACSV